jgi:hypothetical protein
MIRSVAAALLVGPLFAWTSCAMAAPKADEAAATVGAQEPPLCTDNAWLKKIKKQYEGLEEQKEHLKVREIAEVKQLHIGPSPASVNQYANKTNYGTKSRYCQGTAMLEGGKTDPVYWRMDYLVAGSGHSINFDHCSLKHDFLDTKCQKHREGK